MNTTLFIGLIVVGVALLFDIIATAIPNWWKSDTVSIGLFRVCIDVAIVGSSCGEIKDSADWWKATCAMMIMSILALSASMLLGFLFGFVMKDKQVMALGAALMSFAAGGLALLGVIIFGAKAPLDAYKLLYGDGSLHASFGLAIIAFLAAIAGGVFMFLSKGRNV